MNKDDDDKLVKLVAEQAMRGEELVTPDGCPICVIPNVQIGNPFYAVTSHVSVTQFQVDKEIDKMRSEGH